VGDVDEHAFGSNLFAAHFFFQRVEQLVDLHGKRPGFGLAFTLTRSLHLQFRQVIAANRIRQFHIDHGFPQRPVADDQLDVHFRLSPQPGDAQPKSTPVHANRLPQCVVALKNGAKTERKYRRVAET